MPIAIPRSASLAAAALLAVAPACRRDEITHARVPKASAEPAGPMAGGAGGGPPAAAPVPPPAGGGMAGDVPVPPRPEGKSALRWTLPRGWTETGGSGMRYATLKPSTQGQIDVSVVVLPGVAGGELPNVNRWRGQIGLPPIDEAALAAARKPVRCKVGTVSVFDFESEGQKRTRMIAGLLTTADGNTWFLKMVGDSGAVGAERSNFLRFLETLRLD